MALSLLIERRASPLGEAGSDRAFAPRQQQLTCHPPACWASSKRQMTIPCASICISISYEQSVEIAFLAINANLIVPQMDMPRFQQFLFAKWKKLGIPCKLASIFRLKARPDGNRLALAADWGQ